MHVTERDRERGGEEVNAKKERNWDTRLHQSTHTYTHTHAYTHARTHKQGIGTGI
jgi:hypothetical protein